MIIILEFMNGKELTTIFQDYHQHYSEDFMKHTIWQAAKGLADIHAFGILHRDIKSDNIFCNTEGMVKIADLGAGVCLTKDQAYRKTKVGTTQWIAPEVLDSKIYSREIDVWSFGCFMYEAAMGHPPFNQFKREESLFEAVSKSTERNFICKNRSDEFNDLIKKCTKLSPSERITMKQVLEHPYLAGAEQLKGRWLEDYNNYLQWKESRPKSSVLEGFEQTSTTNFSRTSLSSNYSSSNQQQQTRVTFDDSPAMEAQQQHPQTTLIPRPNNNNPQDQHPIDNNNISNPDVAAAMVAAQNPANDEWTKVPPVWILVWAPAAKMIMDSAQAQAQVENDDVFSNQISAAATQATSEQEEAKRDDG